MRKNAKKVARFIVIIFAIIVMFFIGKKIFYSVVDIKPIDLYLTKENSKEKFLTSRGAYEWEEFGTHTIADSVSPANISFGKIFVVEQNEKIYFTDDNWKKANAVIFFANDGEEVARITIECNEEENYFIVPAMEGEYIVQINLESKNGKVWYAAKLNITK